jgi:hypothetical protein
MNVLIVQDIVISVLHLLNIKKRHILYIIFFLSRNLNRHLLTFILFLIRNPFHHTLFFSFYTQNDVDNKKKKEEKKRTEILIDFLKNKKKE